MTDLHRRVPQQREAVRADLSLDALDFLRRHGLHPAPEAYLAHGYVDLCLRAWPTARSAPLSLATRWALWTWTTDDLLDGDLRTAPPEAIERFTRSLLRVGAESAGPAPGDHPAVHALAELVRQTRATMPDFWWQRYREHLDAWIVAARDKLVHYVQPGRTPTLREYLTIRPADGGMLLAAMWCELAEQCVTPDWSDPLVRDLLDSFSTCGILANDLAGAGHGDGDGDGGDGDDGETFNAVAARMADGRLSPAQARRDVSGRLEAEERRFRWLYSAVSSGFPAVPGSVSASGSGSGVGTVTGPSGGVVLDTGRFALLLDAFRVALTSWTGTSSRYASAPAAAPAAPGRARGLRGVLGSLRLRRRRSTGTRGGGVRAGTR
ncbi:hypothetical protein ACIRD3_03580 [Kitasatospora sp. NPDC093550]|uniref:terpene synthase family protein n=1 Tax=Kitasatospora sp. NPDC093550 TaxID=3364089 RepID=UPI00381620CD